METHDPTAEFAALVLACAAAIHQQLYDFIELQNEQIRVLKRIIGKQPRARDAEKRRLAVRAQALSRAILSLAETMVSIDTFRRWHRQLIANTYTPTNRGRPRLSQEVEELVCRLARENPVWGYQTISDRLAELGHIISHQTVGNILRRNGIPPAPDRETDPDWRRFIETHWPGLVALDSATWEVPAPNGRTTSRHHALYAIRLATREVRLLGLTSHADGEWMTNCCRQFTAFEDGFLDGATHVIMDRDPNYVGPAKECFRSIGCEVVVIPPHAPKCNAFIERFIGTTRREVGRKIIPFSTEGLRKSLTTHVEYYNRHRTHQATIGHRPPDPCHDIFPAECGTVKSQGMLGNSLTWYVREAG